MAEKLAVVSALGFYFAIAVGLVVLGGTIVGSIAFWRAAEGQARTFSMLLQRANALQILTAILIVIAACALIITGDIQEEAVVSILSGVAGYVLGSSTTGGASSAATKSDDKKKNDDKS